MAPPDGEPAPGAGERAPAGEPTGEQLLADLTGSVLLELARSARRAFDILDPSTLPPGVRPYMGWKPERLTRGRARQALVTALAESPVLREATGAATGSRLWEAAAARGPGTLVERFGAAPSVVALMGRGRWQEATALDAELGRVEATNGRVGAEDRVSAGGRGSAADRTDVAEAQRGGQLEARVADLEGRLREEREGVRAERRRAEAAQQQAISLTEERARLADRLAEAERQLTAAREEQQRLQTKYRKRLARRDRQLRAARDEQSVDAERVRETALQLERLAASLQRALDPDAHPTADRPADHDPERSRQDADDGARRSGVTHSDLRRSPSVRGGRPCQPPKGLAGDHPQTIAALLGVEGLLLLLDGYNVTLDARGRPYTALPQQRKWLTATAGAVVARFGCRVVIVFDGDDDLTGPGKSVRGVRILFTQPDELADDRIVELLELDARRPTLVVTSDHELTQRCRLLGANVVSSRAFLHAIGG